MASSRSSSVYLNPEPSTAELDPVLTEQDFQSVWSQLEKDVAKLVARALRSSSLHRAEAAATGGDWSHKHALASVGAVRQALACADYLIPDIMQEVRLAMWQAMRDRPNGTRVQLRACKPAILAWLRTTVHFITKRMVVRPATLLFAAGPASPEDSSESASCEPTVHIDLGELVDTGRRLDSLAAHLSEKQVAVIKGLVAGSAYAEIATQLGISESYARGLFHRAKKAVDELVAARDGPSIDDGRDGPDRGSTQHRRYATDPRNPQELLTKPLDRARIKSRRLLYFRDRHRVRLITSQRLGSRYGTSTHGRRSLCSSHVLVGIGMAKRSETTLQQSGARS